MDNLRTQFALPSSANDNAPYAIGDLTKAIVARIADQAINQFKPLLSGLNYLSHSKEFILNKNDKSDELAHYIFQINDDPDSLLDIYIDSNTLYISNPNESEVFMGFDIDGAYYTSNLIPFENNLDAFLYIKDFIEDNHPNYSAITVANIACARQHIYALESQLKRSNLAYSHG